MGRRCRRVVCQLACFSEPGVGLNWEVEANFQATRPELLAKKPDAAYLPYNLFDRVAAATIDGPEKDDKVLQAKVERLRTDFRVRTSELKRIR